MRFVVLDSNPFSKSDVLFKQSWGAGRVYLLRLRPYQGCVACDRERKGPGLVPTLQNFRKNNYALHPNGSTKMDRWCTQSIQVPSGFFWLAQVFDNYNIRIVHRFGATAQFKGVHDNIGQVAKWIVK